MLFIIYNVNVIFKKIQNNNKKIFKIKNFIFLWKKSHKLYVV